MNLVAIGAIYGGAVVAAVVLFLLRKGKIDKGYKSPICQFVENPDKPIADGTRYIKNLRF